MRTHFLGIKISILFILALFLMTCKVKSQSIEKSWFSEEESIYFKLDSNSGCAGFNEFYYSDKCSRLKYKVKSNELKLIWKTRQRIFPLGWEKDFITFSIINMTKVSLELKMISSKYGYFIDEDFWNVGETIKFIEEPNGCYDLFGY